jgi:hypothetical protein
MKVITYEGKEFEIDLERAKELGVLKETLQPITDFKIGDAYRLKQGNFVVVVEAGYAYDDAARYSFSGFGDELYNYSPFGKQGGTREQVIESLNAYQKKGAVFIKNINEDFKKLLKSL